MKLVVEHVSGARRGERQVFEEDAHVRFGRHPECEVAFDAHEDRDASSRHAELRSEDGLVTLVDLDSANGTVIAGARVARHVLAPGASVVVEFGVGGPTCRITLGDPETLVPATVHRGGQRSILRAAGSTAVRQAVEVVLARQDRRTRALVLGTGGVALALTLGVGLWYALGQAARREEAARLRDDVAAARRGEDLRRASDEEARRAQERLLAEGPGPAIVRAHREIVYLLASQEPGARAASPFCTAFAVTATVLATNAHCVRALQEARAAGRDAFAVASGGAVRIALGDAIVHDDYVEGLGAPSWDVGTIATRAALPRTARLATREAARALAPGTRIFTYGFPARLADVDRPEATLTEGVIGRLTTLGGEPGTPDEAVLVQHSAFTTGGTSGSPVLDAQGLVVAINAGGVREPDRRVIRDPVSGRESVIDVGAALTGYNVGLRIDVLEPLMKIPPGHR